MQTRGKMVHDVVVAFKEFPNTLQNLYMCNFYDIQLFFIEKFLQLQELTLSFKDLDDLEGFKELQYDLLPEIQIFNKILKNNGNNLQEFYIGNDTYRIDDTLNVAIANFAQ